MSVSTLTIPTPGYCMACPLRYCNPITEKISCYAEPVVGCIEQHNIRTTTRHPDCPLKIQPEGLRWIASYYSPYDAIELSCPVCKTDFDGCITEDFNYCPSCGVKLDPPEAWE